MTITTVGETDDTLRRAVMAAGGVQRVAEHFGISHQAVYLQFRTRRWAAERIRPLCELGQHAVTVDQVLDYLEQARAQERGLEAVAHGG